MSKTSLDKINSLMNLAEQAKADGNRALLAQAIAGIFTELPEIEILSIMSEWATNA